MKDGSDNGGVVVAIGLILILLLLIGGVGIYYVVGRQHMALAMQAERARLAEAQARMQAEQARAEAEAAIASRTTSHGKESSTGQGDSIRAAVESILAPRKMLGIRATWTRSWSTIGSQKS